MIGLLLILLRIILRLIRWVKLGVGEFAKDETNRSHNHRTRGRPNLETVGFKRNIESCPYDADSTYL